MIAAFFVPGVASPKGSMKAFVNPRTGRAVMVNQLARTKPWQAMVALFARRAMKGRTPYDCALSVRLRFVMPRPKGHLGVRGNAKPSAPLYPAVFPDLDKLTRLVFDALTGEVWVDDGRVVRLDAAKAYGAEPGVLVEVREVET